MAHDKQLPAHDDDNDNGDDVDRTDHAEAERAYERQMNPDHDWCPACGATIANLEAHVPECAAAATARMNAPSRAHAGTGTAPDAVVLNEALTQILGITHSDGAGMYLWARTPGRSSGLLAWERAASSLQTSHPQIANVLRGFGLVIGDHWIGAAFGQGGSLQYTLTFRMINGHVDDDRVFERLLIEARTEIGYYVAGEHGRGVL